MSSQRIKVLITALRIMGKALRDIKNELRAGVTEREIAQKLECFMCDHGYPHLAFNFVIAAGEKTYFPHHIPSKRRIQRGDIVMVDFGVKTGVGCTDITRTFFVGLPAHKQKTIYQLVLHSQKRAIRDIKAGVACRDIDTAARMYLKKKGFAKAFRHSTGHGVGKKVHQPPRIGPRSSGILQTGDIVTIEPGVYLKGWGGIRIEDMVTVGKQSATVISSFIPKDINFATCI